MSIWKLLEEKEVPREILMDNTKHNRLTDSVNVTLRPATTPCLWVAIMFLVLVPGQAPAGQSKNERNLIELALEEFGKLTDPEKKLLRRVAGGELADYSTKTEEHNDPANAENWDPNRALSAKRIAWLCTDKRAVQLVTHKGIMVKGARIDGKLDLMFARIPFPLYFVRCSFPAEIYLQRAELAALYLVGTHTGPITADGLTIKANVSLRDGFKATGEVRLVGATIAGDLDCNNGTFINTGADALSADRAHIKGGIFLCDGLRAEGEVRLLGATIGGELNCREGTFINTGEDALNADAVHVEGSVFLKDGFRAEGAVRFLGGTIGGNLDCENGQFINKGAHALGADGATVTGDLFLGNGFRAEGEVRLLGTTIGGDLDCHDGTFIYTGRYALNAEGVHVKGNVFLCNGFRVEGIVNLNEATIEASFIWTNVNSPQEAALDLRLAKIGTLWDEKKSWPKKGHLFLHGLHYDQIDDQAPRDANSRIDWLRLQYDDNALQDKDQFRPQPYEQLAAVLRKMGHDVDARNILIAKNKDKARLTKLTWTQKLWYCRLGPIIGFGYRPLNALWVIGFLILPSSILFAVGHRGGLITPQTESAFVGTDTGIVVPGDKTRQLSDVYPKFNFLIYSLDVFVPLVDLHQAKYWLPNANRGAELFTLRPVTIRTGGILRFWVWLYIAFGWVLTTLLVVGLTGLVRT
jgi:hypothetical protein